MFATLPGFVKKCYPNRIWNLPNSYKKLYLTFDDGPIPEVTPWVLEQLKKYDAKATFFCIGDNIKKYPEIFKKVISEDHGIGNHTYNHLNGWKTSSERYVKNVLLAEEVINREEKRKIPNPKSQTRLPDGQVPNLQLTNPKQPTTTPRLFRPPYGKITRKQARLLEQENYKIVMWDVLSFDYNKKLSAEKCYQNIVKNANSGSIIVFHDSLKAKKNLKAVLPKILECYTKKGFTFEELS